MNTTRKVLFDLKIGNEIAEIQKFDLSKSQDLLIVMGTSLKIVGVKRMIKDFKAELTLKSKNAMVIFINKDRANPEFETIFDMELIGTSDHICELLMQGMQALEEKELTIKQERLEKKQKNEKKKALEKAAQGDITKFFKVVKPNVVKDNVKGKDKIENGPGDEREVVQVDGLSDNEVLQESIKMNLPGNEKVKKIMKSKENVKPTVEIAGTKAKLPTSKSST
jgi:hypothetical protein